MIEIKNLSVKYTEAQTQSLYQFSLSVKSGECILLTGASGCGKTTLTRCLNGLVPNFYSCEMQGEIFLDGKEISSMSIKEIALLTGSVFQNPESQFFTLDVDSEIAFSCENLGLEQAEIQKRVLDSAKFVGIEHLLGKKLLELSGGQKQSVAIACACATQPKILVLDEPSANLDREATEHLKQILLKLKSTGTTILIAEHKIYWTSGLCDRMIYLENGRKRMELSEKEFRHMKIDESRRLGLRCVSHYQKEMPETSHFNFMEKIEGKQILFYYHKGHPIFEKLNFSLPSGIIGIVGENGIGKSTLARLCVGLEEPQKGNLFIDKEKCSKKKRLHQSYYVMQDTDYQLFSDSVLGELIIGKENDKEAIKKASLILEQLGILLYKDRHPASLSGGEKQRLAIAVALMKNSEILLFDEPTSGLDGKNMLRVSELLKNLAQQGKNILVISHDTEFLLETCDRLLHLQRNRSPTPILFCKENREQINQILFYEKEQVQ